MANLTETPVYESGVFRLETTTPVKGGAPVITGGVPTDGFSNVQAQQLANRTAYLKDAVDDLALEKEQVLTAGAGVTIDRTDPDNPVISGGGGGDSIDGTQVSNFTATINTSYWLPSSLTVTLPDTTVPPDVGSFVRFYKTHTSAPIIQVGSGSAVIETTVGTDTSITYDIPTEIIFIFNGTNWEV